MKISDQLTFESSATYPAVSTKDRDYSTLARATLCDDSYDIVHI